MQASVPSFSRRALRFRLLLAVPAGEGLAYLGFTEDEDPRFTTLNLLHDDGSETRLALDGTGPQLIRTPFPDVNLRGIHRGRGFVIWVPRNLLRSAQHMVALNDQVGDLERMAIKDPVSVTEQPALLAAYGLALKALATTHRDAALLRALKAPLAKLAEPRAGAGLGRIEQCWRIGKHLLLIGRWDCEPERIAAIRLQLGKTAQDVGSSIQHVPLAARDAQGNLLRSHSAGFVLLAEVPESPKQGTPLLAVATDSGRSFTFPLQPQPCELADLGTILQQHPALATRTLQMLQRQLRGKPAQLALAQAERSCFELLWAGARAACRFENLCVCGISAAYALEEAGLLLIGTLAKPDTTSVLAWLHAPDQPAIDVSAHLVFLPLEGDIAALRAVVPCVGHKPVFMLHVPARIAAGARRLLRLELPGMPELWLRIETPSLQPRGPQLAREILGKVPTSEWLWRNFPRVLERGLGTALAWAGRNPAARSRPQEHQFGVAPRKPLVSIIVPLYGRNDFLRHQLAQFCDDADFAQDVDLIYVVDDPAIETDTLNLAGRYQPLFRIPFRVVTYAENRGFAGANNAAAAVARAPLLMMMNSDVLPQHTGWVSVLRNALAKLPRCGMVAPLLQYADGSVQHAGMAATRQFANPELIFSMHPGKGTAWEGSDKPSVHPMLTGACLLLRKKDYEAVGGLDEGYLVGDFEDSDFSLRIRALGKQLYLVPAAKLWHLERQSQYLGANVRGVRDMLTLYNAWRYSNKIAAGELLDPEGDAQCA